MQTRTAAPREHLDPDDVVALLHDEHLEVDHRVERLGLDDQVLDDISEDVALDGSITWTGDADLHRTLSVQVARDLAWDRDRLRFTLLVTSPLRGLTAAFHRGVFVITRPSVTVTDARFADGTRGEAWECKGWDKLRLLRDPAGRTWATEWTETGQLTLLGREVRRLLAAAGWGGPVLVHPALELVALRKPEVWPAAQDTSWLRILNELLALAGADKARVDDVGALHVEPLVDDADRDVEWTLDADDERTIVGPQRTRTLDLSTVPNRWRFIARNHPRAPVLGDGIYEPEPNWSSGPASIAARGREVWNTDQQVDVADHAALVALGDARRARDIRGLASRQVTTGVLPLMGHRDCYELLDDALADPARALASTWTERWDGADSTLTLEEIP